MPTALHQWLDDGVRYHPKYQPSGNSDHLPMTLCALTGLGASATECSAFRTAYIEHLQTCLPAAPLEDWRSALGDLAAYPSLLSTFQRAIAEDGREHVVRETLATVVTSVGLEAFHPVIRLAYGLEFESDVEVAASLAYWVAVHQPFPAEPSSTDFGAALEAQAQKEPKTFTREGFSARLQELADNGHYPDAAAADLDVCAARSLDVYRTTRNFFALHMVTASYAIRVCTPFVEQAAAGTALTAALLAAHQIVGVPSFSVDDVKPFPVSLGKDHVYKYAWTCVREHARGGDDRYRDELARMKAAGLLPMFDLASLDTSSH